MSREGVDPYVGNDSGGHFVVVVVDGRFRRLFGFEGGFVVTRLFKRFQILWCSKVWFGTFEYLFNTKVLKNVLQIERFGFDYRVLKRVGF
jgi:hypothetical protein